MKVIAFNGSPKRDGVVKKGLEIMAGELEKEGIATEIVEVGGEAIRGCVDCRKCRELGRCVFNDDMVNGCAEKAKAADGVILGSPVYYGGIAGTMKSFLDRLFFPGLRLDGKAGVAVASLRRSGGVDTFHQLNNYLHLGRAVIVPTIYWSVIHGESPGELAQDLEGLQIMEAEGRNMAWLLKALALGKRELPPLPELRRVYTNFVRQ
ncbi:MAG: flavodoxin family protein [Treponema sp.]|jgi:multimeric flavodoxin WrbA|nr:flavodoxin family protein [Treponema sp.]